MPSFNIAVLGADPAARAAAAQSIGKKSSTDDMTFYHTVFQGKIVSAVDPSAYPDKLSVLPQAISLCDYALVLAEAASPALGEIIVALDFAKIPAVFVSQMDLAPFLNGTGLQQSKIFDSLDEAKNHLLAQDAAAVPGDAKAIVDHCFDVKGVGTIVLGVMKRGEVKVHDKLSAQPLGREIEVRSIQKNDQDVQSAGSGDRIGFSIKGAKPGEIDRGTVLSKAGAAAVKAAKEIPCEITVSKFCKTPITNGMTLHLSAGLQFEPVKIECAGEIKGGQSASAKLICEKPVAFEAGEALFVCNLNAKGLRVIGAAKPV